MPTERDDFPRTLLLLMIAIYCCLNYLGVWQIQRHYQKERLLAHVQQNQREPIVDLDNVLTTVAAFAAIQGEEGESLRRNQYYRRVHITGTFVHDREMHVYPRSYEVTPGTKKAGFDVITPFKLENGTYILVNRGWAPVESVKNPWQKPAFDQPLGEVTLAATIVPLPRKSRFSPENKPQKNQWFRIDYSEIVKHTQLLNLMPVYVVQEPYQVTGEVLSHDMNKLPIIRGYRPSFQSAHLEYAATWYLLSVILLVMGLSYYRSWYRSESP